MPTRLLSEGCGLDRLRLDDVLRAVLRSDNSHDGSKMAGTGASGGEGAHEAFQHSAFSLLEARGHFVADTPAGPAGGGARIAEVLRQQCTRDETESAQHVELLLRQQPQHRGTASPPPPQRNAHRATPPPQQQQQNLRPCVVVANMNTSACLSQVSAEESHSRLEYLNGHSLLSGGGIAASASQSLGTALGGVMGRGHGLWLDETRPFAGSVGVLSPSRHSSSSHRRHLQPHDPSTNISRGDATAAALDLLTLDVCTIDPSILAVVARCCSTLVLSGSEEEVLHLGRVWERAAHQQPALFAPHGDASALLAPCGVTIVIAGGESEHIHGNQLARRVGDESREERSPFGETLRPAGLNQTDATAPPSASSILRTSAAAPPLTPRSSRHRSVAAAAAAAAMGEEDFESQMRRLLAPAFGAAGAAAARFVHLGGPKARAPLSPAEAERVRAEIYSASAPKRLFAVGDGAVPTSPPLNVYQWAALLRAVANAAAASKSIPAAAAGLRERMCAVAADVACEGYAEVMREYVAAAAAGLHPAPTSTASTKATASGAGATTALALEVAHNAARDVAISLFSAAADAFAPRAADVLRVHEFAAQGLRNAQDELRSRIVDFARSAAFGALERLSDDVQSGEISARFSGVSDWADRFAVAITAFLERGRTSFAANSVQFGSIERAVFNTAAMDVVLQWFLPNTIVVANAFRDHEQLRSARFNDLVGQQTAALLDYEEVTARQQREIAERSAELQEAQTRVKALRALLRDIQESGARTIEDSRKTYKRLQKRFIGESFLLCNRSDAFATPSRGFDEIADVGGGGGGEQESGESDMGGVRGLRHEIISDSLGAISMLIANLEKHVEVANRPGGAFVSPSTSTSGAPSGASRQVAFSHESDQSGAAAARGGGGGGSRASRPVSPAVEDVVASLRDGRRAAHARSSSATSNILDDCGGGHGCGTHRSQVLRFLERWHRDILSGQLGATTTTTAAAAAAHPHSSASLKAHPQFNDVGWLQRVLTETTASIDELARTIDDHSAIHGGLRHGGPSARGDVAERVARVGPLDMSSSAASSSAVAAAANLSFDRGAGGGARRRQGTAGSSSDSDGSAAEAATFALLSARPRPPPRSPPHGRARSPASKRAAAHAVPVDSVLLRGSDAAAGVSEDVLLHRRAVADLVASPRGSEMRRASPGRDERAAVASAGVHYVHESELAAASRRILQLEEQLSNAERERRDATSSASSLQEAVGACNAQLRDAESRLAELDSLLRQAAERERVLRDAHLATEDRLAAEERDRALVEEERDGLQQRLFTQEQENVAAGAALEAATRTRDELEREAHDVRATLSAQRAELAALNEELQSTTSMLQLLQVQLESEKTSAAQYLAELQQVEETLERERHETRQTLLSLENRIAEYLHKIDTLEAAQQHEKEKTAARAHEVEAALHSAQAALEEELRQAKEAHATASTELDDVRAKLSVASRENASLRELCETLRAQLGEHAARADRAQAKADAALADAAHAREDAREQEEKVHQLLRTQEEMEHTIAWMSEYTAKHKERAGEDHQTSTRMGPQMSVGGGASSATRGALSPAAVAEASVTPSLVASDAAAVGRASPRFPLRDDRRGDSAAAAAADDDNDNEDDDGRRGERSAAARVRFGLSASHQRRVEQTMHAPESQGKGTRERAAAAGSATTPPPPPALADPLASTWSPSRARGDDYDDHGVGDERPSIRELLPSSSSARGGQQREERKRHLAPSPTRFLGVSGHGGEPISTTPLSRRSPPRALGAGPDVSITKRLDMSESRRVPTVVMAGDAGGLRAVDAVASLNSTTGSTGATASDADALGGARRSPRRTAAAAVGAAALSAANDLRRTSPQRLSTSAARRASPAPSVSRGSGRAGKYGLRPIDPHLDAIEKVASLLRSSPSAARE